MRTVPVVMACTIASLAATASAGTIYTTFVDQLDGDGSILATVDPGSGEVTEIGHSGVNQLSALTFDPIENRLLGLGQDETGDYTLYELNTATGHASEIGSLGMNTSAGALTYHAGLNQLFAVQFVSSPSGFGQLLIVDSITGSASPLGSLQPEFASSLAYYAPSGQLLFTSGFEEFGAAFGSWDPVTDIQTTIGPTATIFGMDYDPDVDVLYGINGGVSATGGLGDKLFTIDPLTGQATLLVTLDRAEFYSSLAVIPDIPAPPAAFALVPLAFLPRPRRGRCHERSE